jgi:hypothetical protein
MAMSKFKTNEETDLIVDSKVLNRISNYTKIKDVLLIEFISNVLNDSPSVREGLHTEDYVLKGNLFFRGTIKGKENKFVLNVYLKFKHYYKFEKKVSFHLNSCFFKFNDETYKELSKSLSLRKHDHPCLLISELNNDDSYVEIDSTISIPFYWLDENCEDENFDWSSNFKELAILNFEKN